MIVAAVASVAWLGRPIRGGLRGRVAVAAPLVLALAGVVDEALGWRSDRTRFAADVAATNAKQVRIGKWIDATLPADAVVWTIDAGAVRYWGRRRTVDLVRLNTPELFDGPLVKTDWWPTAIVVIPAIFQTATAEPLLDVVLVAGSPWAVSGERDASRQEVHLCLPAAARARDGRVLVLYLKEQVIAVGKCVASH
jgi:hypothetical protein